MSFLTYDTADDIISNLEIIEKLLFPEADFWHDNYLKGEPGLGRRNLHDISQFFKNWKSYELIQKLFSCVIKDKNFRKFFSLPINHVIQHKWIAFHGTTQLKVLYYLHDSVWSFNLKHMNQNSFQTSWKYLLFELKKHKRSRIGKLISIKKNILSWFTKKVIQYNFLRHVFSSYFKFWFEILA